MSEKPNLNKILLSFPSLLNLTATADTEGAPRSWIQLAKVGSFISNRYGEFSITTDDLRQMFDNFKEVTPQAPTEVPIDYDHLSMDPKRPGDGKAAGWMKDMELRAKGEELWGLVEWTPDAARQIENREYRFVSPSFVKDHTHKDGKKIGTTLLAAAITNHPFLEGMQAVTLADDPRIFGDVAVASGDKSRPKQQPPPPAVTPTDGGPAIGSRVTFNPVDEETASELTPEERSQTFEVKGVKRDEVFLKVATVNGQPYGWYPESAFVAASAPKDTPSPLPAKTTPEDTTMQTQQSDQTDTEKKAVQFSGRVARHFTNTRNWAAAFDLAQREDESGALAYRMQGISTEAVDEDAAPVLNLSVRSGESFDQLAQRYALEKGVSLRVAIHEVGKVRPDLAAARD